MRAHYLFLRGEGLFFEDKPLARAPDNGAQLLQLLRRIEKVVRRTRSERRMFMETELFKLKTDRLGILYLDRRGILLKRVYGKPAYLFKIELKNWKAGLKNILEVFEEGTGHGYRRNPTDSTR